MLLKIYTGLLEALSEKDSRTNASPRSEGISAQTVYPGASLACLALWWGYLLLHIRLTVSPILSSQLNLPQSNHFHALS